MGAWHFYTVFAGVRIPHWAQGNFFYKIIIMKDNWSNKKCSKEEFINAWKSSSTYREIQEKLGIPTNKDDLRIYISSENLH